MARVQDVEKLFRRLLGQPAWQVKVGHGSFVTLEFGKPWLDRREPVGKLRNRRIAVHGTWHLWLYCCAWKISAAGTTVAESTDSRERMSSAASELDGQILVNVAYNPADRSTMFQFDLGATLETSPDANADDQWILYHKGKVWTLEGNGQIKVEADTDKSPSISGTA